MAGVVGSLHEALVFGRRTRVLAGHLAATLPEAGSVLDVGCGDGTIDRLILTHKPGLSIAGVDVFLRPVTHIPVTQFDGVRLPYPDLSFEAVMFVDVLHHTDDPAVLLREAARVGRRVVLKDHTMDGVLAGPRLRFMDWVGNAHHGVVLPYNYWPERRWRAAFAEMGLRVVSWQTQLGLYPPPAAAVFERGLHFVAALERDTA